MKTNEEYIESVRHIHFELYMFGERVTNILDNPIIKPTMNCMADSLAAALSDLGLGKGDVLF